MKFEYTMKFDEKSKKNEQRTYNDDKSCFFIRQIKKCKINNNIKNVVDYN